MAVALSAMKLKSSPPSQSVSDRRYFKEVRFRQIRALTETARYGSFAAAARTLGIATTSIWRQVRALEDEYGVQLISARGQEIRLTEDGELLVRLARPLVEGFDSLRQVFADRRGKIERYLRVAAPGGVLNGSAREVISHYRRKHPEVRLSLVEVTSRDAWEMLDAEKVDFAIAGQPQGTSLPCRVEAVPLFRVPFQAVFLKNHPAASGRKLTLENLLGEALILGSESSSSRMQFDHLVHQAGLTERVKVSVTASNVALILSYVAQGMGIAILTRTPNEAIRLPPSISRQLIFRDLTHVLGHDEVAILQIRGRYELPHLRAFREMVVEALHGKEEPHHPPA